MMEHFCTLFDFGFLPQGLALHASLRRHLPDSVLWVLCMDSQAEDALTRLMPAGLKILRLPEVETPELLAVKPGRSRGEYCWTLTSSLLLHVLESNPQIDRLTYLDADLWFRSSPSRILSEFESNRAHTLLTPHDYDPEHDQSDQSGRYCVQFVPFRNTPEGLRILAWWRDRCVEWCFARQEPGRFGDQKYLDEWIPRFGDAVSEISQPHHTLAPWNCRKHAQMGGQSVLFHFHNLRLHETGDVCLWRGYQIPEFIRTTFYKPYLSELSVAISAMKSAGISPRYLPAKSNRIPDTWRRLRRRIAGTERWERLPR